MTRACQRGMTRARERSLIRERGLRSGSLIAASVLAAVLAHPARAQAPAAPPAPPAVAPLPADDSELGRRVASRLQQVLRDPCLATAATGVSVRDARTGAAILERNEGRPLKPASNMKLVTGSAALALLGPERALKTTFRADRQPGRDGSVGALYVVGGGDPSLTVEALYLAARALALRGVRSVDRVVVDDSFFAGPLRPPAWPERNHSAWYGAPTSALSANFNVVAVHARGGARNGEPAATWLDPFPDFFDLNSSVRTGRGGIAARGTLVASPAGQIVQRLSVTGRVAAGRGARILVPIEDPALFCGHGVVESLRRVGVEVTGGVSRGAAPSGAPLLHEQAGKPMSEIVRDMNKPSSNMFAETLLKVLGAELYGAPGTREKGVEVLRAWLEIVAPGGCTCSLSDGSGLSPENRLTPRLLTDLLLSEQSGGLAFPEYLTSLPVSGADGTLRRRFKSTHARRLVRAKTGRIAQVAALAGFARIGDGREAVFSILVNDYTCPQWKAERAVDALVEALVADAEAAPDPRRRLNLPPLLEDGDGGAELPMADSTEESDAPRETQPPEDSDGQEQGEQPPAGSSG